MAHFNGKINNYFAHCADLSDLKREYHRLVMIHHPDVGGDTATMQAINAEYEIRFEALKSEHNAANDADHQTTEMPNEFIEIITALLHLSGLRVELCGSWIWITGETLTHKDKLKSLGCRWSPKKVAWSWHHAEPNARFYRGRRTMNEIRQKYGSIAFGNSDAAVAVV